MSGWTERQSGKVKIEHWSTSSAIRIIVKKREEVKMGVFEDVEEELWLDYEEFGNLREVINQTDFP